MTEWLTTGQMIDRLRVGEVAIGYIHDYETYVKKLKTGNIAHVEENGEVIKGPMRYLTLSSGFGKIRWKIKPSYVSFEEAMKALKTGKTIKYHIIDGRVRTIRPIEATSRLENTEIAGWALIHLIDGKWTIEGDTP